MPSWDAMFSSTMPVLEVVLRASILYLVAILLLRLVGQRESGGLSITDLLVVVLVGQAVAQSLSTGYLSIPEAVLMVATVLGWSLALDALAYRWPRLGRLLKSRARPLIEDGEVNQRTLRRELLSRDELDELLRLHGVTDVGDVARAYLEPNGMVSVFTRRGRRRADHG